MSRLRSSRNWIVTLCGVLLWGTMTLIPILRAAPEASPGTPRRTAVSAASLTLTVLPLICLVFGALRHERILYQFLFPLLLLATQFASASSGWDDPIQYGPNGIAFALYFIATAFVSPPPDRIAPISTISLDPASRRPERLNRDALVFLPHAIAILALALAFAAHPAWDAAGTRPLESEIGAASSHSAALVPFASVCLALAALALHVGHAFYRARELASYLRPSPITANSRWAPTRRRFIGTLLFLAVGIGIGITLHWV